MRPIERHSISSSIHRIPEKTRRRAAIEFESALGNKKSTLRRAGHTADYDLMRILFSKEQGYNPMVLS
jgi:hypothetical protein